MNRELTELLGNPFPFLAGSAIALYVTDHYVKSPPTGGKKALVILGAGLISHIIWRKVMYKGPAGIYVQPANDTPVKGVKQTR